MNSPDHSSQSRSIFLLNEPTTDANYATSFGVYVSIPKVRRKIKLDFIKDS